MRAIVRELPLTLAVAVLAAGIAQIALGSWRLGSAVVGGSALLAMALRLVLSDERAGMLAVRGKAVDVVTMLALGIGVLVPAVLVPA